MRTCRTVLVGRRHSETALLAPFPEGVSAEAFRGRRRPGRAVAAGAEFDVAGRTFPREGSVTRVDKRRSIRESAAGEAVREVQSRAGITRRCGV